MVCDIMAAIGAGVGKPTLVAYRANVSWAVLTKHLGAMQDKGLISKVKAGKRVSYVLTQKGFEILAQYRKVRKELGIEPVNVAEQLIVVEPFVR